MSIGSRPDWIKGIQDKLDYHWRYSGHTLGILPDTSIILSDADAELRQFLAAQGIDESYEAGCFQCGTCAAICPYTLVSKDNRGLSARRMLHERQLGLNTFEDDEMWLCTTCDNCVEQCPRGVEIIDFMRSFQI